MKKGLRPILARCHSLLHMGERRPDEEGIETPCDAQETSILWANADLMKKGLRPRFTKRGYGILLGERRPDEEGIETGAKRRPNPGVVGERRPDEEGIETLPLGR